MQKREREVKRGSERRGGGGRERGRRERTRRVPPATI
jgi:hypothetical protein